MSPELVMDMSLGTGDRDVTSGLVVPMSTGGSPTWELTGGSPKASRGSLSGAARKKLASRSICIHGCQRNR